MDDIKKIQLDDNELNAAKEAGLKYNTLTKRYGEIIFELRTLDKERLAVEQMMVELDKEMSNLHTSLQQKYGAGSLDLNSGMFTPATQ